MKRFFALFLAVLMLLSLAACKDSEKSAKSGGKTNEAQSVIDNNPAVPVTEEDLLGSWRLDVTLDEAALKKMSPTMEAMMFRTMSSDKMTEEDRREISAWVADAMTKSGSLHLAGTFTFHADKTYSTKIDESSKEETMNWFFKIVRSVMPRVVEKSLKQQAEKTGMSEEAILAQSGASSIQEVSDQFVDLFEEQMRGRDMLDMDGDDHTYEIVDGKLMMHDDDDSEMTAEMHGGKLVIMEQTSPKNDENKQKLIKLFLPIALTRVS